jgi:hypothetical protein
VKETNVTHRATFHRLDHPDQVWQALLLEPETDADRVDCGVRTVGMMQPVAHVGVVHPAHEDRKVGFLHGA